MTTYYLPDITGADPDYLQVNHPQAVYRTGQRLFFENSPIYAHTLQMTLTDGSSDPLVKDVDWSVTDDDIDQAAMSRAFLENPGFTRTLVSSVTLISNKALNKQVACTYQEFYLTTPGRTFDDGTPFEVTPDLIKQLIIGQADLRQQVARVFSPVAPVNDTTEPLPFDINAEFPGNVVTGEVHTVNTVAGAKVIRLTKGAYFADSLVLTRNGVTLSPEVDYLPVEVSPLTRESTNRSGIYKYILLNGTITDSITARYHAVGGEVQIEDLNSISDRLLAIKQFLDEGLFITKETVTETPAFRAVSARLNLLESGMRSILSGAPTYGDVATGASIRRPVAAIDSNFHWYTIASLYQVQGSPDIITTSQFRGRVFFPTAKVSLAFVADVNLNQPRNPISFRTESLVFDPTYTLFGDISVAAPIYPMVRLAWSQVSQSFSGAVLQIGIPLTALSDQMIVENLSSQESCWLLDESNRFILGEVSNPSAPKDNNFVLPDGNTTWSSVSGSSFSRICVPQYTPGYLVYSGATVTLNQLTTTASTKNLFNPVLPAYFPINSVTSLVVTIASPDSASVYDIEIPLPLIGNGTKSGRVSFVNSSAELMSIAGVLYQDPSGNVTMSLNIASLIPAGVNPGVDLIRYVRAKV